MSKVCVVGPSSRNDADIDYSFFQIGISNSLVDTSGNCGNMSSAMGPFAYDEGLTPTATGNEASVRIHNTNTNKIIVSRFPVENGSAKVAGDQKIDGVSGSGAPIRLEFLDPGGANTGKLLPADGNAESILHVEDVGDVHISMIDAANPCAFISPSILGMEGTELPEAIEADTDCMGKLEAIRCKAAVEMGIAASEAEAALIPSIPKIAMVFSPKDASTLSGKQIKASDYDIGVRMISIGKPHRAVPLTGGLCLAVAVRTPGTLPSRIVQLRYGSIRIGHPSGILEVDAEVIRGGDGPVASNCAVYRTARRLFEGHVLVPAGTVAN